MQEEFQDYDRKNQSDMEIKRNALSINPYLLEVNNNNKSLLSHLDMDTNINSSEEVEHEKAVKTTKNADEEADDEHSDWNENTGSRGQAGKKKNASCTLDAIPWWDQSDDCFLNYEKASDLSRRQSSYERLNLMQPDLFNSFNGDTEKEFKEMLSGALCLMDPESVDVYQSNVSDSMQKQNRSSTYRKKRFNSFASDHSCHCNIATKSTANLNSLITEAQAGIF